MINKKFIVIEVSMYNPLVPKIRIDTSYLKLIEMNIIEFMRYMDKDQLQDTESYQKIKQMSNNRGYSISDLLSGNMNYLFKLHLVHLFKNENLHTANKNFNVIFVLHNCHFSIKCLRFFIQ